MPERRSLNKRRDSQVKLRAGEKARRRKMRDGAKRLDEFVASLPRLGDSSLLIREDRDQR
jgi:hypothetical protein